MEGGHKQLGSLRGAHVIPAGIASQRKPTGNSWYVDSAIGSSGNGQSWGTAWKALSNIVWGSIQPGDTIYLSGGKTYSGALVIGASGSAGLPITITRGVDSGHDGTPILDGGDTSGVEYGIDNGRSGTARNYIVVSRLTVQNYYFAAVGIRNTTAGCVLEDCDIHSGSASASPRCIDVRTNTGITLRGNRITTVASTAGQTDGIYSQGNVNYLYEDNTVTISNTDNTGHSDALQSTNDGNGTVRNNTFISPTAGANNHPVWLYAVNTGSTMDFYNNLCISRGGQFNTTYWRDNDSAQNGTVNFYHNVIYGGSRGFNYERVANVLIKNNIVWPDASGNAFLIAVTGIAGANITHNLVWAPSASIANVLGVSKTWSQWQADGANASGVNADPLFTNAATYDFTTQAASPARNAGTALAAATLDRRGVLRPQGAAVDIGAYET